MHSATVTALCGWQKGTQSRKGSLTNWSWGSSHWTDSPTYSAIAMEKEEVGGRHGRSERGKGSHEQGRREAWREAEKHPLWLCSWRIKLVSWEEAGPELWTFGEVSLCIWYTSPQNSVCGTLWIPGRKRVCKFGLNDDYDHRLLPALESVTTRDFIYVLEIILINAHRVVFMKTHKKKCLA